LPDEPNKSMAMLGFTEKVVQLKMMPMQLLLLGAILLSVALVVHEAGSETGSISWWIASAPWIVWIVSPYIPLFLFGRRHVNRARSAISYILTVTLIGFAVHVYVGGSFTHQDAQSALLFIFVPLYQWLITLVGGIIYLIVVVSRKGG